MLFTLKRPKSKRFYQLRFDGFNPEEKRIKAFLIDLGKYLIKKFSIFTRFLIRFFGGLKVFPQRIKAYFVRKLIWSRGKLGKPVANLAVMTVAFFVFMFGEVLNSSSFVSAGEVSPDYLSNVSDIIPNLNTATTLVPDDRKRSESFEYTISEGDTLSSIGNRFKISVDAIEYVNNLTDYSVLKIGQVITIPPISGLIHTVEDGDTLDSIAEKYDVPTQAVADFNYILDTSVLAIGTELVIPGAKVPQPVIIPSIPTVTSPGFYAAPTPSKNFCIWPTSTGIITQYYAWYHNGIDIATPHGSAMPPIFSCTGGTVVRSGWDPYGLGLHIRIDHGNGYETVYGHLSSVNVGYGQSVSRGQVIGVMGNTGRSTGPHLHFVVKYNGVSQNPLSYTN